MNRNILKSLGIIVFFLYSCSNPQGSCPKNDNFELSINIKPKINGKDMVLGNYFAMSGTDSIQITRLDFYISAIQLSNGGGVYKNSGIFLYSASKGLQKISITDPCTMLNGTSISFLVGLDSATNNSDPNSYPATSPLSSNKNMYWTDWTKYRYVVFEGEIKTSTGTIPFAYHTGLSYKYETAINASITLNAGMKNEKNMNLNIEKIFNPISGSSISYSLGEAITHSTISDGAVADKFAINFSKAFSLE